MVTGVETAGLVLAAFPLVVSGLGSYVAGANTLRRWRNERMYGRELKHLQRQLETQRVIYLNTLEELFSGIVHSDAERALLINDPSGPTWKRKEYETLLHERLGQSYHAYLATVNDLRESITLLEEKTSLSASERVSLHLCSTFHMQRSKPTPYALFEVFHADRSQLSMKPGFVIRKELENLKIVLPESRYERCLTRIKNANRDLLDLTYQTHFLSFLRNKTRAGPKTLDALTRFRSSARSLHRLLMREEYWKCESRHNISIRLEPSASSPAELERKTYFRILVSCEPRPQTGTSEHPGISPNSVSVRRWKDVEIEPTETIIETENPTTQVASTPLSSSPSEIPGKVESMPTMFPQASEDGHSRMKKLAKKTGKAVRFVQSKPAHQIVAGPVLALPKSISDICSLPPSFPATDRKCSGCLMGEPAGSIVYRHDIYVVGESERPLAAGLISLDSILRSPSQRSIPNYSKGISLSRRDRLFLAASLASSAVKFDGSWLKKHWGSRDIFFLQHDWPTAETKHPYLSWRVLVGENPHEEESLVPIAPMPIDGIHKEILFPLGLMLIELSLARTWADIGSLNHGKSRENTNNLEEPLRLVYDESGLRYGDAVRSCLFWRIDSRGRGFDDDDYLLSVFEQIVLPLVDTWRDFEGRRAHLT